MRLLCTECVACVCVSHLEDGTGVCAGEGSGFVKPQNKVPARQTLVTGLRCVSDLLAASRILLCLFFRAKQALVVEPVSGF